MLAPYLFLTGHNNLRALSRLTFSGQLFRGSKRCWPPLAPPRPSYVRYVPVTEAACWAHARLKIHDVHVRTPSALTEEALKQIGQLYAIEADIRGMPIEQRLAERQRKTKPLLKSLESWLREKIKTLSRHSELTKAFAYALNKWLALTYYADDGWTEADNNIAENALRTVSLGRKNFLFFGSDHGGERGALPTE